MNIIKEEKNNLIEIKISGRLDKLSSPQLDDELKSEIVKNKNILFDFKDLTYISSAGLRVLLSTKKIMKKNDKDIEVVNINGDVMSILAVSGFDQLLGIKNI